MPAAIAVRLSRRWCTRVAVAGSFGPVVGTTRITAVLFCIAAGVDAATPGCLASPAEICDTCCWELTPSATTSSGPLKPGPKFAVMMS